MKTSPIKIVASKLAKKKFILDSYMKGMCDEYEYTTASAGTYAEAVQDLTLNGMDIFEAIDFTNHVFQLDLKGEAYL